MTLSFTSLFSGAGGLDVGFEQAGWQHAYATDIDHWSVATLRHNRPHWHITEADIYDVDPQDVPESDAILAGFPCQGFSLGGHRKANDQRNLLFMQVVRLAQTKQPRYVVLENVLNLRTMKEPVSGKPFVHLITEAFEKLGYHVRHHIFRMSEHGVPQTRRRFIFLASKDPLPTVFNWLPKEPTTSANIYLNDLANTNDNQLPNHAPVWHFQSKVHVQTGQNFDMSENPIICRLSRTSSDGHPLRSLDQPFPAVDTATIWGWAHGHVHAERKPKNRNTESYVRNPNAKLNLWRISASRLRAFTDREYARLQTFPDDWQFIGQTKRQTHQQIGNAVPIAFAKRLATWLAQLHNTQTNSLSIHQEKKHPTQLSFWE